MKAAAAAALRPSAAFAALLLLALVATPSCNTTTVPAPEIVLAIDTDVALPDSVDTLRVEITTFGAIQFGNEYPVGAGKLLIPATLGILRGKDPSTPVQIRLFAKKNNITKMVREVTTTIPSRTVLLRIPIRWLCDESGTTSKCAVGQTCIGGDCADSAVDLSQAPDFSKDDVFGGPTKTCFDVTNCMSGGEVVVPDDNCTIPKPAGAAANLDRLNIGLSLDGDGVCSPTGDNCFVVIDHALPPSIDGWRESGDRIQLARAVCTRRNNGRVKSIVTTSKCPAKVPSSPICGSWSPVGTPVAPITPTTVPDGGGGATGAALGTAPGVSVRALGKGGCKMQLTSAGIVYCGVAGNTGASSQAWIAPLTEDVTPPISPFFEWSLTDMAVGPVIEPDGAYWLAGALPFILKFSVLGGSGADIQRNTFAPPGNVGAIGVADVDSDKLYVVLPDSGTGQNRVWAVPSAAPGPAIKLADQLSTTSATLSPVTMHASGTTPLTSGFVFIGTKPSQFGMPGTFEKISKQSMDGGTGDVVATPFGVGDSTLDGDTIFYLSPVSAAVTNVYALSIASGNSTQLATHNGALRMITTDATDVWFLASKQATSTQRGIFHVPKAGGTVTELAVTAPNTQTIDPKMTIEGFVPVDDKIYYAVVEAGTDGGADTSRIYVVPKK